MTLASYLSVPYSLVFHFPQSTVHEILVHTVIKTFDVFLIVHHSIDFSKYQLNAQFFYSSTICMLHHAPQHVPSSTLLIIRRTNCITTASGIVTLCKQPYSMRVESSPPAYCTAVYRGDNTRGCGDTNGPPDDEKRAARNMLTSVM